MTERFEPVLTFARRHRVAILISGLALGVASGFALTRIRFESDVLKLIPRGGAAIQAFQTYVDHFESLDFVYIIFEAPEGYAISDYDDVVEKYVAQLRALPQIDYVDARLFDRDRDWNYLFDRILLLLGPEQARAALDRFEPDNMRAMLLHSREALTVPSLSVRDLVQSDPLGLAQPLSSRFADNKSFFQFDPFQDGYVSKDGGWRLVIAKPTGRATDGDFCKDLHIELAAVGEHVRADLLAGGDDDPRPPVEIEIAGAYRNTNEADSLIRGEMKRNTLFSLILLLTVIFVVFRSYWIVFCAATTLGLAGLMAMVLVGFSRGNLLAAASGGAAMLFGLGMDGITLLYLRFLEERSRGVDPETATRRLSSTVSSVFLGNITTVATFVALVFVDFPSLEELGRLVGLGMLLCAGLTLLFVPAFLAFQGSTARNRSPSLPRLARLVERRPVPILAVAGSLTLISLVALPRLVVVASLEKLQPRTEGSAVEAKLRERFQFPNNVLLVLAQGKDLDDLLEKHRALERELHQRGEKVPLANALALLPTSSDQEAVSKLVVSSGLTPTNVWPRFDRVAVDVGFRAGVFDAFRRRLPALFDPDERITYDGLIEHGFTQLVQRFIAREDDGYAVATYVYPDAEADVSRLAGVIEDIDPSLLVTGQALVNQELHAILLPEFLKGILIGSLAVIALIYLAFGSIRSTLWCLLPTLLGLLWSVGLFAIAGIELDLFSVFAIVMVIGIGVDYGIHIVHRYRLEGDASLLQFLPWTGAAISLAAVTTVIGFGTVAFSSYAPLARLGIVSATSVAFVAFASLLVLPVLLRVRGL